MADSHRPLDSLQQSLGYRFADPTLLTHALKHRSWCAENPGESSNERLEFLGDAVVDLAVTEVMYENQPEQAEGSLAKARAEVVSEPALANLARDLGVGELVMLGRGEETSGGRDKDSILADAMEAVFAAIYLDGGWDDARHVVAAHLASAIETAQHSPGRLDYKTRLQEVATGMALDLPAYRVHSSGPHHSLLFTADVQVGSISTSGTGPSKKTAEQAAARMALGLLGHDTDGDRFAASVKEKDAEGHGTGKGFGNES